VTDAQLLITRNGRHYDAALVIVDKGYAGWHALPDGVGGRNLTLSKLHAWIDQADAKCDQELAVDN
jgi:hypothetical protein